MDQKLRDVLRRATVLFGDLRPNDVIYTYHGPGDYQPISFYLVAKNDREDILLVRLDDGDQTLLHAPDYCYRDLRDFKMKLFNRKSDAR